MLGASSQGLGLSLPVVCVRRQARLFLQDSTIPQCQIRRCITSTSAPLVFGHDVQTVKDNTRDDKERQGARSAQYNEDQGMVKTMFSVALQSNTKHGARLSAFPNLHLHGAESSSSTCQNLTRRRPDVGKELDAFPEQPVVSCPSGRSLSTVKQIRWRGYLDTQKHSSAISVVGGTREDALHTKIDATGVIAARDKLLRVLESTVSAPEAWDAYTTLCNMIPDNHDVANEPFIPFAHLHRLCRLLSSNRPKTHLQFLRLLSASNFIRGTGGRIHLHEWNAIIDHAGKGWRKVRPEDWESALSLYNDMINGHPPGTMLDGSIPASEDDKIHALKPDVYTFNSLLNIAVEITEPSAVRRVTALLDEAGITPNRITYLTLLKYYGRTGHMSGVRSTILRMKEQGLELGLDGINACMWAYGQNGRHDLVKSVYRLLRHNMSPEQDMGVHDDPLALAQHLEEEEYVRGLGDLTPDETTFATVIQIMAYHGDLFTTLNVFIDMLVFFPVLPNTGVERDDPPIAVTLMNTVFRAIFLGFSRHGIPPLQDEKSLPPRLRISNPPGRPRWSLQNLQTVFDVFLNLPKEVRASRATLHWIMQAFDTTSGNDEVILREAWKRLDERFGMCWVAPTNRLATWKRRLFPEIGGDFVQNVIY
ncbi:hypothetical protein AX15_002477 [Amanita polypyramis BW_CC]|nr:hypothetical protein AX15_002477 [Amanita polypyramis BW_CC]